MPRLFEPEDIEKLVSAVADQLVLARDNGNTSASLLDSVNWDIISDELFEGKFSSSDCIFEFLKLPISESLKLDFET